MSYRFYDSGPLPIRMVRNLNALLRFAIRTKGLCSSCWYQNYEENGIPAPSVGVPVGPPTPTPEQLNLNYEGDNGSQNPPVQATPDEPLVSIDIETATNIFWSGAASSNFGFTEDQIEEIRRIWNLTSEGGEGGPDGQ